jgi:hypothetical protein
VNSVRYAAYRAAVAMLDEARPFALPADERTVLRDCAEGLLLCRETGSSSPECSELSGRAALALARAVMEDRWSNEAADKAWLVLCGCGPAGDAAADEAGGRSGGREFSLLDPGGQATRERPLA